MSYPNTITEYTLPPEYAEYAPRLLRILELAPALMAVEAHNWLEPLEALEHVAPRTMKSEVIAASFLLHLNENRPHGVGYHNSLLGLLPKAAEIEAQAFGFGTLTASAEDDDVQG